TARVRRVAGGQDTQPGYARSLEAVVGLLLDQVIAAMPAHAHPVGDVLPVEYPARRDRAQLGDVVPGTEPPGQDDLLHRLPAGAGLPVAPGRQGLEVDRIG